MTHMGFSSGAFEITDRFDRDDNYTTITAIRPFEVDGIVYYPPWRDDDREVGQSMFGLKDDTT